MPISDRLSIHVAQVGAKATDTFIVTAKLLHSADDGLGKLDVRLHQFGIDRVNHTSTFSRVAESGAETQQSRRANVEPRASGSCVNHCSWSRMRSWSLRMA